MPVESALGDSQSTRYLAYGNSLISVSRKELQRLV